MAKLPGEGLIRLADIPPVWWDDADGMRREMTITTAGLFDTALVRSTALADIEVGAAWAPSRKDPAGAARKAHEWAHAWFKVGYASKKQRDTQYHPHWYEAALLLSAHYKGEIRLFRTGWLGKLPDLCWTCSEGKLRAALFPSYSPLPSWTLADLQKALEPAPPAP